MQTEIAQMICGFKLRQGKRTDTDKAWADAMETAGRILALTDAKHEAPAEGAGDGWIVHDGRENPAPGQRVDVKMTFTAFNDIDADTFDWNGRCHWRRSDRARSSAPEALGNLLAVIHRDGGHRTLEVGVEQAAAEAEKIVANLLSSAPEAREGEAGE